MSKPNICTQPGHTFHSVGEAHKKQRLLSVTPGIPLIDALYEVSNLLSTIEDSVYAAAMGQMPLQDNAAWLVNHTLESAKAVIDCLIDGAESDPQGGVL
ncbi:MAG: DUF3077 domain-containing protein [Pseudomonas marincola]|jgi:hypothetical protein|uniref:DUF3077 domain-containing protein n=1 Tax=Pseudomonas marincola TaxID=437900 RepID=UPI0030012B6A